MPGLRRVWLGKAGLLKLGDQKGGGSWGKQVLMDIGTGIVVMAGHCLGVGQGREMSPASSFVPGLPVIPVFLTHGLR